MIALTLNVISTDDYRQRSFTVTKENLRLGIMSGSIVDDGLGGRSAVLSAFRLIQKADPTDPDRKFEQVFGCPTIKTGCGNGFFNTPFPAYDSGNPVPPPGSVFSTCIVELLDGRSDACCAARGNALRFHYVTPQQALASFRLTWDRDKSYSLDGDIPEGLPAVPLPGGMPLLLGGIGALGLFARRARRAMAAAG